MSWIVVGTGIAAFFVGAIAGLLWSVNWVRRFELEAKRWGHVNKDWIDAYTQSNMLVRSLRQELIEMHHKITKLTLEHMEVLTWVNRNVRRAKEENAKLYESSTMPSPSKVSPSKPSET